MEDKHNPHPKSLQHANQNNILYLKPTLYQLNDSFRVQGQYSRSILGVKIEVRNQSFGQKSKFWSKMEILVKNRNFGQK